MTEKWIQVAGHEVKLDRECQVCFGCGIIQPAPEEESVQECENCGGIGYIPTERGQVILNFVRIHLI